MRQHQEMSVRRRRLLPAIVLALAVAGAAAGCRDSPSVPSANQAPSAGEVRLCCETGPRADETETQAEVACTPQGARLLTPQVVAGPAGVRVGFTHPDASAEARWSVGWSDENAGGVGHGADPGTTTQVTWPLSPGRTAKVSCMPSDADPSHPQWQVTVDVTDPRGLWVDTRLACVERMGTSLRHDAQAVPRQEAAQAAQAALTDYFGTLQPNVEFIQLGYPQAAEPIFGVVRDGRTLARLSLSATAQDTVVPSTLEYCSSLQP